MGSLNVIVIDGDVKRLAYRDGVLLADDRRLPLHLVGAVINFSKATLSSRELVKLADAGVSVVLVDGRNRAALICGAYAKNGERKAIQYRAFYERRLSVAKWVLRKKIEAAYSHIPKLEKTQSQIQIVQHIKAAQNIDVLMGIEGSFSKRYFARLFEAAPKLWHKNTRSKRPPRDPLNALMSFGYMQMYHYLSVRIVAAGYEPSIGFLHTPFRDHNALASDLLEAFRADIDAFVLRAVKNEVVGLRDFSRNKGVFLRYEGRKKLWKVWREELKGYEKKLRIVMKEFREVLDGEKAVGVAT